mmetsp:Transcript_15452/g.29745  ORF Transcript_15452/g.29745 Transcript_15452/m.29745 type:complete len:442 (+) Transcript_15452:2138-3463(+)
MYTHSCNAEAVSLPCNLVATLVLAMIYRNHATGDKIHLNSYGAPHIQVQPPLHLQTQLLVAEGGARRSMQQVGGVSAAGNSTPVTDDKGGSVASPKESETPAPTIVQNIAYDAESRFSSIDDHFDASDWSDASPAARVDFAERQEMYAVKLAKAAMLVYLRHDTQGSLWELRESEHKFAAVLTAMRYGSHALTIAPITEPQLLDQLHVVEMLWLPVREIARAVELKGDANSSDIEELAATEAELIASVQVFSSLVREHVEAAAELDEGTVRDKASLAASRHAGMQRVRTQVMVLKYAMVLADYRTQESAADLAHEAQAFEATIRGLRDGSEELGLSPATSEDVLFWIRRVEALWHGRRGMYATLAEQPSLFRLAALAKNCIPLAGRSNVIVGVIDSLAFAAPPPPPLPPPPPPPHNRAPPARSTWGGCTFLLVQAVIIWAG